MKTPQETMFARKCLRQDGPCSGEEAIYLWRAHAGIVIQHGPTCDKHAATTGHCRDGVRVPERVSDEEAERLVSAAEVMNAE